MKLKLVILTVTAAIAVTGCETATNTSVNVNVRNANSNTAVLVNANAAPVNANRSTNSNVNRADYDKNRADYEREKGSSTIGQGVNDSWTWFKTKSALATTDDLRDSTINVDVVDDVITLKGTVGTAAQKAQAETVAKGIEGQKGVKNQLTVKANDSMTNQMVNGNTKGGSNTNKK